MNATEIIKQADKAITAEHMNALPQDDYTYATVVGRRIDRVENTVDTLASLLMVSFDEALVIVLGTLIQRRK